MQSGNRGAPLNMPLADGVDCLIVRDPGKSLVIVAGNDSPGFTSVQFKYRGKFLKLHLPKRSVTTLRLEDRDL